MKIILLELLIFHFTIFHSVGQIAIEKRKHTVFSESSNLASKTILDMHIDKQNQIWISANGIMQYFDGEKFAEPVKTDFQVASFIDQNYRGKYIIANHIKIFNETTRIISNNEKDKLPEYFFILNGRETQSIKPHEITINSDTCKLGNEIDTYVHYTAINDSFGYSFNHEMSINLFNFIENKNHLLILKSKINKKSIFNIFNNYFFYFDNYFELIAININTNESINTNIHFDFTDKLLSIAIGETSQHELIIGMDKTVFTLDKNMQVRKELRSLDNQSFIKNSFIKNIKVDMFDNIYLGTSNEGLIKIGAENNIQYIAPIEQENKFCKSIFADKINNNIIYGTWGNGLIIFDTLGRIKHHFKKIGTDNEINTISHISKIENNKYLLYFYKNTIAYILSFNKNNKPKLSRSNIKKNENTFLTDEIDINPNEKIITSINEAYRITIKPELKSIKIPVYEQILSICAMDNCYIESGINNISIHDKNNFELINKFNIPLGYCRKVLKKNNTEVYLGTDRGLYIFNLASHKYYPTDLREHSVFSMIYDNQKYLWVATNKGIFKIKDGHILENLGIADGLQDWEFNTNAAMKTEDGELYFGGVYGANAFFPTKIKTENISYFIDGVSSDKIDYNSKIKNYEVLNFPYETGLLKFKLSILTKFLPSNYNKQYYIEGITKKWIDIKNQNEFYLTLPVGKHKMYYSASKHFQPNAKLKYYIYIDIYKPFYLRVWFWMFCGLASLILITYLINFYKNIAFEKKKAIWQTKESLAIERNRMSRELHDFIGAQLSIISRNIFWLTENKETIKQEDLYKKLDQISVLSSKINNDVRDTIWASKKETLSVDDLFNRLKVFSNSLSEDFTIKYANNSLGYILSSLEAINILRICQEAIINAVKYSRIDKMEIVTSTNPNFEIYISDKGIGFNLLEKENISNGISNIKDRANEINYHIEITTSIGYGCTIKLSKNEQSKN